jgi:ABC-type multidrug transport system ATPase subunit
VRFHNLLSAIGENIIVILSTHIVSDVSDLCRAMAVIHEGRVRMTGDPAALVAGLAGKVWRKSMTREELSAGRDKLPIISMRLFAGQTMVHVLSDEQPEAGFEIVSPDLEDLYFATIKGFLHAPESTAAN